MRASFFHPYLLLSAAVLFWAGNSVVGRLFAQDIPPLTLVFWRWSLALLILTPICLKSFRRDLPIIKKHLPYLVFQGILSVTAFNAFLYWGLHSTTVVSASLILAGMPIVTLFFSIVILKKGLAPIGIVGILLSLGGVAWVVSQGNLINLSEIAFNIGDLLILISVLIWSIYSVLLAKFPQGLSRLSFAYTMVLAGLVVMLPLYLIEAHYQGAPTLNANSLLALLYIGIFPSVLALMCWNKGVEMVGANTAGIFLNLMPIFGTILGVILLNEDLFLYHYYGMVFILVGVFLVTRAQKKAP